MYRKCLKKIAASRRKEISKDLGRFFFCFVYCRARAVVRFRSYRLMMLHVYNEFPRRGIFTTSCAPQKEEEWENKSSKFIRHQTVKKMKIKIKMGGNDQLFKIRNPHPLLLGVVLSLKKSSSSFFLHSVNICHKLTYVCVLLTKDNKGTLLSLLDSRRRSDKRAT